MDKWGKYVGKWEEVGESVGRCRERSEGIVTRACTHHRAQFIPGSPSRYPADPCVAPDILSTRSCRVESSPQYCTDLLSMC